MIAVTTSGPLFEGTLDVRRGQRVGMERATARAADLARGHLRQRARYRTPKYGHVVDAVRTKIAPLPGSADQLMGTAYLGGPSYFLGPILEVGTGPIGGKGRKRVIPLIRVREERSRGTRGIRGLRRSLVQKETTLAFVMGGKLIFRRAVYKHPGTRGYRWAAQSQAAINREAPALFEQAMAEALKA